MEDARRVYAAKLLNQLGEDLNKEYPNESAQSVVVYPRAHAIRIANYMTDTSVADRVANRVKEVFYKLPGLDRAIRTYEWKDSLAKQTDRPELASWNLTGYEELRS